MARRLAAKGSSAGPVRRGIGSSGPPELPSDHSRLALLGLHGVLAFLGYEQIPTADPVEECARRLLNLDAVLATSHGTARHVRLQTGCGSLGVALGGRHHLAFTSTIGRAMSESPTQRETGNHFRPCQRHLPRVREPHKPCIIRASLTRGEYRGSPINRYPKFKGPPT
jgi:hypothetical protein